MAFGEFIGRATYLPFNRCCEVSLLPAFIPSRGQVFDETAVTSGQRELLLRAIQETNTLQGNIAEVGSWRGVTTVEMAKQTAKRIYAVDPHNKDDFPGVNEAYEVFAKRISSLSNVIHVRESSGKAAKGMEEIKLSLVFIDAMHDCLNAWYDFYVWSRLIVTGGIVVMHDIDDHVGANLACRRVLKMRNFEVWGYCPNIVAFRKKT